MKIKIDPSASKDEREFVFIGTSLKAYLLRRSEKPSGIKSSVYILMNHRRTGFYIGESGDTTGGGFVNRFQSHVSKKTEKWWDVALCFIDSSELFDQTSVRRWIESRLNEIAREKGHLVLSTAGASGAPPSDAATNKLKEILDFCWLLGIPWAEEIKSPHVKTKAVGNITKHRRQSTSMSLNVGAGVWHSKTQLARLIAQREKKPGSLGHLLAFLGDPGNKSRRRCPKDSCWRKPLEDAGVKFDKNDFVSDWTCAKNPL